MDKDIDTFMEAFPNLLERRPRGIYFKSDSVFTEISTQRLDVEVDDHGYGQQMSISWEKPLRSYISLSILNSCGGMNLSKRVSPLSDDVIIALDDLGITIFDDTVAFDFTDHGGKYNILEIRRRWTIKNITDG